MRLLPLAAWCAWAPLGAGALGATSASHRRQALREALLKLTAKASAGHRDQGHEVDASRFWFQSELDQASIEELEQAEQAFSSHVIMDDGDDDPAPHASTTAAPREEVGIENPPDDEAMSSGQVAAAQQPEATASGAPAAERQQAPAQGISALIRDAARAGSAGESGSDAAAGRGHAERATALTHAMPGRKDEVEEVPAMLDPVVAPVAPNDDCAFSMWSEWSDCQQLHDGYKVRFAVRTRVVIAGEHDSEGVPCPVSQPGGLLQQRACVRVNSRWTLPAGA